MKFKYEEWLEYAAPTMKDAEMQTDSFFGTSFSDAIDSIVSSTGRDKGVQTTEMQSTTSTLT